MTGFELGKIDKEHLEKYKEYLEKYKEYLEEE